MSAGIKPNRNHPWVTIVLAVILLAGGVLSATMTARSVAHRSVEKSRDALALSSEEVASTLRLAIQREEDLAVSATGFFLGTPIPSNDQFLAWANTVQAMERYPELLGWGEVVMVTAAQLEAYMGMAAADPAGVVASGTFELVPPGDRPFYCLFVVGESRNPDDRRPARLRLLRRVQRSN